MSANWKTIDVLFQLTDDEVRQGLGFGQEDMFTSDGQVDDQRIESYLFVAIELKPKDDGTNFTRTDLSRITRALNHQDVFRVPIMLLFRHGDCLSLAVINRRLHKRDASRDVLEKVTLIKDIAFADPLRAHIEILHDLALPKLYDEYKFTGFVGLHQAWEKRLASYALNERFYREIADWYFDALQNPKVVMPRTIAEMTDEVERDKARSLFFIRLLTRLIFCWFLQEKGLVPRDLFRERRMKEILKDASPTAGTYYRAFLQNLFFATLNQEQDKRDWREKAEGSARYDKNVGITHLWRFKEDLRDPAALEALLRDRVPFVNGGLFDCLDDQLAEPKVFLDGFSERKTNTLHIPNALFFGKERTVDLSDVLHDKRRSREKVSGLINILSRYKFTIEENTPLEEEIALDPELLGKVFENLLASFNEDTQTTARKALGAFYTPRAVVSYMVDEALCSYLGSKVPSVDHDQLTHLMKAHPDEYEAAEHFTPEEIKALVAAIGSVRIIDHAAGSGAYPMGALQRLVDLLQKLDPNNESWKRDRLEEARRYYESLRMANASDEELRQVEERIADIEKSFDTHYHELDYARKLFLIENSIYGVDIQPVACQIAKLRFFIAMIVDQKVKREAKNLGVRPMPNLETKIVAANALLPIDTSEGEHYDFFAGSIQKYREELLKVRHDHFDARTPAKKAKLRKRDAELRKAIADELESGGLPSEKALKLASWDPYDQNGHADYFDPSWMFGFKRDDALFDIVIGNPPFGADLSAVEKDILKDRFSHLVERIRNSFLYFIGSGYELLRPSGTLSLVLPNEFLFQIYMTKARRFFLKNATYRYAINMGDHVFKAVVPTCLVGISRPPCNAKRIKIADLRKFKYEDVARHLSEQDFSDISSEHLETSPGTSFNFDVVGAKMISHLTARGEQLESFCEEVANGISTSHDKVYILDVKDAKNRKLETTALEPCLRGGQIKRYYCPSASEDVLIYITGDTEIRNVPMCMRYLEGFKKELISKSVEKKQGIRDWHVLFRPRNRELFKAPKLLLRQTGDSIVAAVDPSVGFYCIDSLNVVQLKEKYRDLRPTPFDPRRVILCS
jgi:adenine-specific DNA-methyltransferase